jgi:hypothetical protein
MATLFKVGRSAACSKMLLCGTIVTHWLLVASQEGIYL